MSNTLMAVVNYHLSVVNYNQKCFGVSNSQCSLAARFIYTMVPWGQKMRFRIPGRAGFAHHLFPGIDEDTTRGPIWAPTGNRRPVGRFPARGDAAGGCHLKTILPWNKK